MYPPANEALEHDILFPPRISAALPTPLFQVRRVKRLRHRQGLEQDRTGLLFPHCALPLDSSGSLGSIGGVPVTEGEEKSS